MSFYSSSQFFPLFLTNLSFYSSSQFFPSFSGINLWTLLKKSMIRVQSAVYVVKTGGAVLLSDNLIFTALRWKLPTICKTLNKFKFVSNTTQYNKCSGIKMNILTFDSGPYRKVISNGWIWILNSSWVPMKKKRIYIVVWKEISWLLS